MRVEGPRGHNVPSEIPEKGIPEFKLPKKIPVEKTRTKVTLPKGMEYLDMAAKIKPTIATFGVLHLDSIH